MLVPDLVHQRLARQRPGETDAGAHLAGSLWPPRPPGTTGPAVQVPWQYSLKVSAGETNP
jgi:hypothetical protein